MNQLNQAALNVRPWYKEPWPWLLMSLPLTAIIAGTTTLVIAVRSDDGLVSQDYYTKGLAINTVLASRDRAIQLGLGASLQQQGDQLRLVLESKRAFDAPMHLLLVLNDPARSGFDQVVRLRREGDAYVGFFTKIHAGRWNLTLEDEGSLWQLYAETSLPLQQKLLLLP